MLRVGPAPVSVLDLAPVPDGSTSAEALRNTVELAQRVEALGFHRLWVAEHHNMPGIASSAPAVLIARLADATERMRIGSGGVMLPNHAPLVVAEQFGMLEALHPGRIDLGIGRAPGTDQRTALALRRTMAGLGAEDFPQELAELRAYFTAAPHGITAVPAQGNEPEVWLLGSSDYSAQMAGLLGLPFSFAHHFMPGTTEAALAVYRHSFRPGVLEAPRAMVAVNVVCADDDERAAWLAGPIGLSFLRLRQGRPGRLPSPEEAAAYEYSPAEREGVRARLEDQAVGSPETVLGKLHALRDRTGADELMITTMLHGHADRVRSFELVAAALREDAERPAA
jgi:luciferase family oxidoreductase group 1